MNAGRKIESAAYAQEARPVLMKLESTHVSPGIA